MLGPGESLGSGYAGTIMMTTGQLSKPRAECDLMLSTAHALYA